MSIIDAGAPGNKFLLSKQMRKEEKGGGYVCGRGDGERVESRRNSLMRLSVLGGAGSVARRRRLHVVGEPSLQRVKNEFIHEAH